MSGGLVRKITAALNVFCLHLHQTSQKCPVDEEVTSPQTMQYVHVDHFLMFELRNSFFLLTDRCHLEASKTKAMS